jgi:hypothetical protein
VTEGAICVIRPGSNCRFRVSGSEKVDGIITAVSVREGGAVSYEVVWWNGRDRQEALGHRKRS